MDTTLKVNRERINARLSAMGKVGALPGGGVCRLALSDEDRQGRDLIARWMHEMDLEVTIDWIGNIIGIRAGLEDGPVVMTGSHLDTVATGGLFDGSFGVLAGLEVIQTLNERGIDTRKPIALAVFTNEEGVRFMPDMMGSLVFCGKVSIEEARAIIATDGSSVGDNLDRIGYSGRALPGSIPVQCFVELHVEQGPVLAAKGITIGAVEVVQGISWFEFVIGGVTNHAGTTPMESRHDAGYGAASIACFVSELCTKIGHEHRATVGSLSLSPNLVNVIPG